MYTADPIAIKHPRPSLFQTGLHIRIWL